MVPIFVNNIEKQELYSILCPTINNAYQLPGVVI